ncbi:rhomboid family intramembrane serine protease [Ferrimonas balearica]|uniref:rhomboid family intramembrane serine protease n=1 Tax=Ferrimonas balearica TaxID=44012 RepID=UPI001C98E672|nr:rhomboid family intramembrane serine protease [Ferrimonas balearica]MBY5991497.1 rhomboid family intramembrane serine protease [Ferrimonas balearica]
MTPARPDRTLSQSVLLMSWVLLVLWIIKAAEWLLGMDLSVLGVAPRTLPGLVGIPLAPLIHGSAAHLAANSVGLLVLGAALIYGYPKTRWKVVALVWLVSGVGVWLFARPSVHFGASGLTHGIFFYLLLSSLLRRDKRSLALMMIAFFMFGGMIYSIFPREMGISYESHLAGAIAGVVGALLWWRQDPKPEVKRYDWEGQGATDEEDPEDPIGDLWRRNPDDEPPSKP